MEETIAKKPAYRAVPEFEAKSGIAENEMVIFESVSDNIADFEFGASKGLGADKPVGAPASPDGDSIQRTRTELGNVRSRHR